MPSAPPKHRPPGWQSPQQRDRQRPSARHRGYDAEWQRLSAEFLRRRPVCVTCGQPATVTDHIVPHRGNERLRLEPLNWQPLCRSCHARKTAAADGGFGNPRRPPGPAAGRASRPDPDREG